MAREGIRVLAVARGALPRSMLPELPDEIATLKFVGLIGFTDPLRESVPAAVHECRTAGIRVVMITGDYPETARAIARQAGIEDGQVHLGRGPRAA